MCLDKLGIPIYEETIQIVLDATISLKPIEILSGEGIEKAKQATSHVEIEEFIMLD